MVPAPGELIERAEKELNVCFPPVYREFLSQRNGGVIEPPFVEDDEDFDEFFFFPVFDDSSRNQAAKTANHLVVNHRSATEWIDFPENALAIGEESGTGDYFVLLSGDDGVLSDTFYHWDHDTGRVTKFADSIVEFSNLEQAPDIWL